MKKSTAPPWMAMLIDWSSLRADSVGGDALLQLGQVGGDFRVTDPWCIWGSFGGRRGVASSKSRFTQSGCRSHARNGDLRALMGRCTLWKSSAHFSERIDAVGESIYTLGEVADALWKSIYTLEEPADTLWEGVDGLGDPADTLEEASDAVEERTHRSKNRLSQSRRRLTRSRRQGARRRDHVIDEGIVGRAEARPTIGD